MKFTSSSQVKSGIEEYLAHRVQVPCDIKVFEDYANLNTKLIYTFTIIYPEGHQIRLTNNAEGFLFNAVPLLRTEPCRKKIYGMCLVVEHDRIFHDEDNDLKEGLDQIANLIEREAVWSSSEEISLL